MILKNEGMKKGIQIRVPQTIDLRYFPKNIVNPDNKSMSFDELYNEFYSHTNYPDLVYLDNRLSPVKMIFLSRNAYTLWYIEGTYILHDEKKQEYYFCNFISEDNHFLFPCEHPFNFHYKVKIHFNGSGNFVKINGTHNYIGILNNYPIYVQK